MKADCVLREAKNVSTEHFSFFWQQIILNSENFLWSWFFEQGKWVPVTTAWRVLRLRMEEPRPVWRVAANIFE
jgi:hypothetical protein